VSRRGPRPVQERLRRLLVMLPWLMERGEAPLAEMTERFQVSEKELIADLEQVACCGLPPFLDECIDLYVDDGVVYVGIPRFFTRPLRLTAPEGFALLAAGRAALALPGADSEGPLARALAKLAALLGDDAITLEFAEPALTERLVAAAGEVERLRIDYWSAASGEQSSRVVTPRAVYTDRGRWYLVADDDRSGEQRTFRVDRITALEPTGERGEPREVAAPMGDGWLEVLAASPDAVVVTLELGDAGRWVVERHPVRIVRDDGATVLVELVVGSERWLRDLLLQLGPDGRVVVPDRWAGLGAAAAAAVLQARYSTDS
jgi:proteasome accessory factor C